MRPAKGFRAAWPSVWAAAALLVAGLAGCEKQITDRDIEVIGLSDVQALIREGRADHVAVVDSRSPARFAEGRIPGARNMQLTHFSRRPGDVDPWLDRHRYIVVYGEHPGDATAPAVTKRLLASGYKRVRLYREGFADWMRAGMPVDRPAAGGAAAPATPSGR